MAIRSRPHMPRHRPPLRPHRPTQRHPPPTTVEPDQATSSRPPDAPERHAAPSRDPRHRTGGDSRPPGTGRPTVRRMPSPPHRATPIGDVLLGGTAGIYCGAAIIGLYLTATGTAWTSPHWTASLPIVLGLGALLGWQLARRPHGILANTPHRTPLLIGIGALSMPAATAIGTPADLGTTGGTLLLLAGVLGIAARRSRGVDHHASAAQHDEPSRM